MKFILEKNLIKTEPQQLSGATSLIMFGFDSQITGLNIVFENKDGTPLRYHIPDTALGFANDSIYKYTKLWFEYSSADKRYEIELTID